MLSLKMDTTNLPPANSFPEYSDPFEDQPPTMATDAQRQPKPKPLARLQSDTDSSRGASPQPTHFSVLPASRGGTNGNRVLRSATVGYVAPEFKGKEEQMQDGESSLVPPRQPPAAVRPKLTRDGNMQSGRSSSSRSGSPSLSSTSRSTGSTRSSASTTSTSRLRPPP